MIVLSTVRLSGYLKEQLEANFPTVTFHHDKKIDEAAEWLPVADIILTYGEDLTEEHIKSAKKLKWIMVASAGIEKLPFQALEEQNIHVTNSKGVHAIPMAEYCLSMMLQVSRKAKVLIENEKQHIWDRRVRMEELYEKTVLIVGAGAIGSAIARIAAAFGMNVVGVNSNGRSVEHFAKTYSIADLLVPAQHADFIISILPSTEQTKGTFSYEVFNAMKETTVFINIGRGDAVVESDLIRALNEKQLSHAVLDVFDQEPLEKDHPFWDMENVTVTPHISGITKKYLPRSIEIFEKNLECLLNGRLGNMTNIINLNKRY